MNWVNAVRRLREQRRPGVLATVTAVRGHAPREAGAKMVVAGDSCWGTIGGGNLEEVVLRRAREMLSAGTRSPETTELALNDKVTNDYGRQCCGGQVTVVLDPLAVVPSVAIVGMGHVGAELARILARHEVELHLADSRAAQLAPDHLPPFDDAVASIHLHHVPVPELVLGEVPSGTNLLIMTHDHAEDIALVDSALRCAHLGPIGLIGSSAKWRRFEVKLAAEGHSATDLARVITPIGLPDLPGKEPAAIAVSVAAALLRRWGSEGAGDQADTTVGAGDQAGPTHRAAGPGGDAAPDAAQRPAAPDPRPGRRVSNTSDAPKTSTRSHAEESRRIRR